MSVPLIRYYSPVLKHDSNGYYLLYYCYCKSTGRMERVRLMLNRLHRYTKGIAFRAEVTRLISELNAKLLSGWTPWDSVQSVVCLSSFDQAFGVYQKMSVREHRECTHVSYCSCISILQFWLQLYGVSGSASLESFSHSLAVQFMDWLYSEPDENEIRIRRNQKKRSRKALSNNGWNTYLKKYLAIFNWFVEHDYISSNPFTRIKCKRKEVKTREPISREVRDRLRSYCEQHNPGFLVVMELVYFSLLRPKEISLIQIRDVNLYERTVFVSENKAKTHKAKVAVLSEELCHLIAQLHIDTAPLDWYLIGKDFCPAKEPAYSGCYKKFWSKLRDELHLPMEYQLYSLKDSGIIEKLENGMDTLSVMRAADHSDLSITTNYVRKVRSNLVEQLTDKAPSF